MPAALAALIGRLVGYAVVVFALVYSLESLGVAIGPLLGALGIIGIALAFAFRDILENFIAGILLQLQRPFTYGDQVAINDFEGTVRDVGARLVTIRTPDGETVKIPAATVIKSDLNNYTEHGLRRTTVVAVWVPVPGTSRTITVTDHTLLLRAGRRSKPRPRPGRFRSLGPDRVTVDDHPPPDPRVRRRVVVGRVVRWSGWCRRGG